MIEENSPSIKMDVGVRHVSNVWSDNMAVNMGPYLDQSPSSCSMQNYLNKRTMCDDEFRNPEVGEVTSMPTYPVTPNYNIMYLPVRTSSSSMSRMTKGHTFALEINCVPIGGHNKKCIVIPVNHKTGTSLTNMCACFDCVGSVIARAGRQNEDPVVKVWKEISGHSLLTTEFVGSYIRGGVHRPHHFQHF